MQFVGDSKLGDYDDDDDEVANNDRSEYRSSAGSMSLSPLILSERTPRSTSLSPMPLSDRTSNSMADSQIDSISSTFLPARVDEYFYTQDRELVCDDALIWLESFADNSLPGCVFTSLPDISEVPEVAKGFKEADRFRAYKGWFTDTAALLMRKMKPMTYAVFLQSDIRVILGNSQITEWVDKSHLLCTAADREGCTLMWHKIVLLSQGAMARQGLGRPLFSHLLCFGKGPVTYRSGAFASPDIFDRGHMLWPRAIGLDSCFLGLTFLKEVAQAECVIDPFCGVGTVCAMANALGMATIGVELSAKRCKKARSLTLRDFVAKMEHKRKCFLGHRPASATKVRTGKNKGKAESKAHTESKDLASVSDVDTSLPSSSASRRHGDAKRRLRASAEAKQSLELQSDREESCQSDCSTISTSPRMGLGSSTAGRSGNTNTDTHDRHPAEDDARDDATRKWTVDKKDDIEEPKEGASEYYSIDAKLPDTPPMDDAKAIYPDNFGEKTELSTLLGAKELLGGILGIRGGQLSATDVTSVVDARALRPDDVIRISAALMTAGGAGLDDRVAITSPFGAPVPPPGTARVADGGTMNAAEIAAVFLYVAPTAPAPAPVSAFSSRLMGHKISADPALEAERKRGTRHLEGGGRTQGLGASTKGEAHVQPVEEDRVSSTGVETGDARTD